MRGAQVLDISLALAVPVRTAAAGVRALPAAEAIEDGELVARAQRGDGWAEDKLYRRHVGYVFGLATRLLRNSVEAEDVVQDTFAIALEQLGSLRDGTAVRAWLAQIAVSQTRRRFRRKKLLQLLHIDTSVDDATLESLADPGADSETRTELSLLDDVLVGLPTEHRVAWMLRYVEGETLEDVARIAGCSLATAKRWIAAADARVRFHVSVKEPPV